MATQGITHLDLTVDEKHLVDEAADVVLLLRPSWTKGKVRVFNEGISSNLVGCRHSDDQEHNDVIIVKTSEKGRDFDPGEDSELQIMTSLHSAGYSPPVYATFNNGIIYGFIPGETLNIQTVRGDKMIRLIAAEMAKLHSKSESMRSISESSDEPFVFARMRKWLTAISEWPDLTEAHESKKLDLPDVSVLQREVDLLKNEIGRIDSPVVFCHNDLYAGNIVYNPKTGASEEPDFSLYPDKTYQFRWLRIFLEEVLKEQNKYPSCITDEDIHALYMKVNKLSLVVHLTVLLWGYFKALSPDNSFDYKRYADNRLEEYFRRKKDFLYSENPHAKDEN